MGYRHKMGADKAFAMGSCRPDRGGRPIHWTLLPHRGNAPLAGSMHERREASEEGLPDCLRLPTPLRFTPA